VTMKVEFKTPRSQSARRLLVFNVVGFLQRGGRGPDPMQVHQALQRGMMMMMMVMLLLLLLSWSNGLVDVVDVLVVLLWWWWWWWRTQYGRLKQHEIRSHVAPNLFQFVWIDVATIDVFLVVLLNVFKGQEPLDNGAVAVL
jgi:hypothetical protein